MQPWAPAPTISYRETTGGVKRFNKTEVIRSLEAVVFKRSDFLTILSIFNSQG